MYSLLAQRNLSLERSFIELVCQRVFSIFI
jgi:hypothetical protein